MKTVVLLLLRAILAGSAQAGGIYDLELVAVKPGIYLIRRPDPLRQPVECKVEDYMHELEAQAARKPLSPRAAGMLEDLKVMDQELLKIQVTPADLTFDDRLILHRGGRDIEVRYFGKANTDGDAVVWLPQDKVLVSGDIVVNPIPYGIGSFPREWIAALQAVSALPFDTLVPGHGEVLHDRAYLEQLVSTLTVIREQVAASVARGLDLEATRKALDTSSFEAAYTLNDPLRKPLFDAWWVQPIARSAWLEARGEPIVQSGTGSNN